MQWYAGLMTTTEIEFRYMRPPSEAAALALAHIREVYGVRAIRLDRAAQSLRVEFDATRLNTATIAALVRRAGLEIAVQEPAPTEAAPAVG
jgi:hypothetical protein